jgi:hypothetical protein
MTPTQGVHTPAWRSCWAVDLRLDGLGERLDAAGGSVDAGWADSVTITPP